MQIAIETEPPGAAWSLFRILVGGKLVAEHLTAAQVHILAGEILDRFVLQGKPPPSHQSAR